MRTQLVRVGNSRGVRIPKALLEQLSITDEVEMDVQGDALVLRRGGVQREGWDAAFTAMADAGDDKPVDEAAGALSSWDAVEWEW
jgi:antitoxin MazE